MISKVIYQDNGEYPPPEEIEITKGFYRIEGRLSDFTPDESVQYLELDAAFEHEGELKRIHFNKLDILSNGGFIAEIKVIDNAFFLVILPYIISGLIGIGALGGIIHLATKFFEAFKEPATEISLSLQWIALIVLVIGVTYTIKLWK